MERKLMIAPSMGCCDLFDMERQVRIIDEKSDFLHMDIKDGVYVPSFGIGPEFLAALKDKVSTPMDAHLMIKNQQYLETFAKAGAAYIYAQQKLHRRRCFCNDQQDQRTWM